MILMIAPFSSVLAWAWRRSIDRIFSRKLTFREYAEFEFLHVSPDSIRRLHSVLLGIDGQESIETFNTVFNPAEDPDLEVLRTLILTGKVFRIFNFQKWKSQLRMIIGYYNGYKNLISEFLWVGAPDEINPLFPFRIVDINPHPHISS